MYYLLAYEKTNRGLKHLSMQKCYDLDFLFSMKRGIA